MPDASLSLDRGRDAVKAKLLEAACEMLAESGPNAMTVRSVAMRAGVNHGQVHHYFGGKQGLINCAAEHLAAEHYDHAFERAGDGPVPPALTLSEDSQYLRAFVRMALDGDAQAAEREEATGSSVPAVVREHINKVFAHKVADSELKARLALTFALELGWAAMEPVIFQLVKANPNQQHEVRAKARRLARQFLDELDESHQ